LPCGIGRFFRQNQAFASSITEFSSRLDDIVKTRVAHDTSVTSLACIEKQSEPNDFERSMQSSKNVPDRCCRNFSAVDDDRIDNNGEKQLIPLSLSLSLYY
jgi:hypothetical protein